MMTVDVAMMTSTAALVPKATNHVHCVAPDRLVEWQEYTTEPYLISLLERQECAGTSHPIQCSGLSGVVADNFKEKTYAKIFTANRPVVISAVTAIGDKKQDILMSPTRQTLKLGISDGSCRKQLSTHWFHQA